MRNATTGIGVVSTDGPAGRYGLTVSAFASVSADPPMVLVCVNRRSPARAAIADNRRFCVNVLSTAQRALSECFAGRPRCARPYAFSEDEWRVDATGAPVLVGALATFDCVLETVLESGSHSVFLGRVLSSRAGQGEALLYTGGDYARACRRR